ncbi:MAG: outer membrane protein assembly factor BamD [Flavobacteriales bacterium]|nr:outer membrane protein assembly factor BamD [Flavobacteriales bacterium]
MLRKALPALLLIVAVTISGCSKYQKILKSNDFEKKYEMAQLYYDNGKYQKAFPLLEELITVFRGTAKAEDVYFLYAYCNYRLGDYMLAGYHFNNFVKTFPRSSRAEEAQFMNAKCYFLDSPEESLDQSSTYKAIAEIQLFINRYPNSDRVAESNDLMDRLRAKLEAKSYRHAKLYFRLGDYKAAIFALRNTIKDFPDSKHRDELGSMVVKASYELAFNSIESKQQERYRDAIKECDTYLEKYPESIYLREVSRVRDDAKTQLQKLQSL